jgi:hypothetical protein
MIGATRLVQFGVNLEFEFRVREFLSLEVVDCGMRHSWVESK